MPGLENMVRGNDPAVIADTQGFITEVNDLFEVAFGWSRDEIVGQALSTIIPESLRNAHQFGFSRFLATGQPTLLNQSVTLKVVARDGREIEAEHFIVAEQRQGRWMFGATIRPLNP